MKKSRIDGCAKRGHTKAAKFAAGGAAKKRKGYARGGATGMDMAAGKANAAAAGGMDKAKAAMARRGRP